MHPEGTLNSEKRQQGQLPLMLDYLPDDLKRRAKSELFEDEDTRIHSLRLLRTMLKDETDLHYQDEDLFLLAFLRARKFDVKRAFQLMKTFYTVMGKRDELYFNFNFEDVRKTFKENSIGFLTHRDDEGCVILIIKAGNWNPHNNTAGDLTRTLTSGLCLAILSPATHIAGFKVILDFGGVPLSYLPHISPTYVWTIGEALQNSFPGRFRAIHVVNEGVIFSYIWAILKQFLTKKIRERFFFHGKNLKKLHKYFSPRVLPDEYGGELPPFDNNEWGKMMSDKAERLTEFFQYGYQKSKAKSQDKTSNRSHS